MYELGYSEFGRTDAGRGHCGARIHGLHRALAEERRAHPQDDLISGLAQYISGNRDPLRFKRADELDLNRKDNPLHTFGLGTHYCLGAPLARLELQVLFKILFQRWPDLRFSDEIEFSEGFVIRGLKSLPIEF